MLLAAPDVEETSTLVNYLLSVPNVYVLFSLTNQIIMRRLLLFVKFF